MNFGTIGEDAAEKFLLQRNYKIIERNFRIRNGEIDIIAIDSKENALVFVEVKTRSSHAFGTPFEAIHYWKLKALRNAAQVYKSKKRGLPELLRIDAVAITITKNGEVTNVEHSKNISGD